MMDQTLSLGERIVLAARLAVEEHLRQAAIDELAGGEIGAREVDRFTDGDDSIGSLAAMTDGRPLLAFAASLAQEVA